MRFGIVDFSRVVGIPKTLRFYYEKELLIPTAIGRETGYRFYDQFCFHRATSTALKRLDFSLDEVAGILG
jgi:DNA-binding transcriptional MerR regulator